jgi:chemotaxis response regulator CheB
VCIGGSAGALEAFSRLFEKVPSDTGCGFVVINHARTVRKTWIHKILTRHTPMPVQVIEDGLQILPNHVYVIPPACDLRLDGGRFVLEPISKPRGWSNVITIFLESMAHNWEGLCVGVIVSGMDCDGIPALRSIRRAGGLIIVQAPETAQISEMPQNAIETDEIDHILSPEGIGTLLGHIGDKQRASKLRSKAS